MKIPTEDFIDKTLAIDDTQGDDGRGGDWGPGQYSQRIENTRRSENIKKKRENSLESDLKR